VRTGNLARGASGGYPERLGHHRADAGEVAQRLAEVGGLGRRLEVGMVEAERPAGAMLAGPEAERVSAQLDTTEDLPGVHEHGQAIAGRRPERGVPVVQEPDLGGHHDAALIAFGAGLEGIDGQILDTQALQLQRDPFLHFIVQERHARPFGQSHATVTSP
jgi:hypothetical protein